MVQQLAVYDESGAQVGMTFPKRARQLISKQRALWHDDSHTAIKLLPEPNEEVAMDVHQEDDLDKSKEAVGFAGSDELLMYIAKKNVKEKKNLIKHIIAYILSWPIIVVFYEAVISNTNHPSAESWNRATRAVEAARIQNLNATAHLSISDAQRAMQAHLNSLTHPIMYIIIGVMIAWGVMILASIVKRIIAYRIQRVSKAKRDPVQMEYQRLKGLSTNKI